MALCTLASNSPPRHAGTAERGHWVIIALAFLAILSNYLDRQTLSVVAPMQRDQLRSLAM